MAKTFPDVPRHRMTTLAAITIRSTAASTHFKSATSDYVLEASPKDKHRPKIVVFVNI